MTDMDKALDAVALVLASVTVPTLVLAIALWVFHDPTNAYQQCIKWVRRLVTLPLIIPLCLVGLPILLTESIAWLITEYPQWCFKQWEK
jgi:ABC-type molybdate transport system permease subunit